MGNCFSDPSKPSKKGGQVLGSGPSSTNPSPGTATAPRPAGSGGRTNSASTPAQPLGGGVSEAGRERERALAAAEERAKAASKKGVNASNPNAGKLSSKLQEERRTPRSPEPQQNDARMMDKGNWN